MALFLAFSAITFYEERDALGRVSFLQSVGTGIPADFILGRQLSVLSNRAVDCIREVERTGL